MDKPWYKHYDPDVPHTIDTEQYASFAHMLEETFEKYDKKPCFYNFNTNITYSQVNKLSQRFAGYLQSVYQCVRGDRIAVLMLNTLQTPVSIFGALRAGLIVVGISPLSSPEEINRILHETEPKCVLVLSNLAPILESALSISHPPCIKHILVSHLGDLLGLFKGPLYTYVAKRKAKTPPYQLPNVTPFKKTILKKYQNAFTKPVLELENIAYLSYTSGRDETPKCVIYSHRNLVALVMQLSTWFIPFFKSEHKGMYLVMMPMYHPTNLLACFVLLRGGYASDLITNPRDISGMIHQLQNHTYVGTLCISRLLKALLLNDEIKKVDFSSFKFTGGWGGFWGIDIIRWKTLTGTLIMSGYGSREIQIGSINPYSQKTINNKVGIPLPSVDVKLCDENGNEVLPNTRGELWVRGPQVMKGYWNKPDLTKACITDDGWYKTGDIMTIDNDGYLGFIDRKCDVIMTTVGPVYPSDIEVVIAFMKGIQEVVVTGLNSKEGKYIIKAFIVKTENEVTAEAVIEHCKKYLLTHQLPHEVEFREELPKTDMGYLFRRRLREEST